MEHFELAKLFLESIPELASALHRSDLFEREEALELQLREYFGNKMRDYELGKGYESTLESAVTWDQATHFTALLPTNADNQKQVIVTTLDNKVGAILDDCDEINRTRGYENNQSRGHGSPGSRPPSNLPTPQTQPVSPATSLPNRPVQTSTERPPKRPRLAPKSMDASSHSSERTPDEPHPSLQPPASSNKNPWQQSSNQGVPSTSSTRAVPAASFPRPLQTFAQPSNANLVLDSGIPGEMPTVGPGEQTLSLFAPIAADQDDFDWAAFDELIQLPTVDPDTQEEDPGDDEEVASSTAGFSRNFAPAISYQRRNRGKRATMRSRR